MGWRKAKNVRRYVLIVVALVSSAWLFTRPVDQLSPQKKFHPSHWLPENWFAVFSCRTPAADGQRDYNCVFSLPLTALAWDRIGFKSIVQIIGTRSEWIGNPLLAWVLENLEATDALVMFIDAAEDQTNVLTQTAPLFVTNMDAFPAGADDYLVTSDADLWPLNPDHYTPKFGVKLVLTHSQCCRYLTYNNSDVRVYPMSNIGATTRVWRQVMNDAHWPAKDAKSIVDYLASYFGEHAPTSHLVPGEDEQVGAKLVSIRIDRWIRKDGHSSVLRVSDKGFSRFDRAHFADWEAQIRRAQQNPSYLEKISHVQLAEQLFSEANWNILRELLILMYGDGDWRLAWADWYQDVFNDRMSKLANVVQ